jgi:hypothetical protein
MTSSKQSMLELIGRNIAEHGWHVYLITGAASPRYAYTIGLTGMLGAEIVLAGGSYYSADDVKRIIEAVVESVRRSRSFERPVEGSGFGTFGLVKVCDDWARLLLLGAMDYYGVETLAAYQIVPDAQHSTIDVPDLGKPWETQADPAWKWFRAEWPYAVPRNSVAVTNLAALKGQPITEVTRWEDDQWEMFAGSGTAMNREDARFVPLGVLLGADPSLAAVVDLGKGCGLWREGAEGQWRPMGDGLQS